jgi:hypothetical protein
MLVFISCKKNFGDFTHPIVSTRNYHGYIRRHPESSKTVAANL